MSEEMKDPRYRMLQAELRGLNTRMDAFIETQRPKAFVADLISINKAAAFADTRVECIGFDLFQISSDGDMTDISYKVVQLNGTTSLAMEAAESPQFLGPISAVLVTNDTAEAGRTVRITRFQGNIFALAAIKHGTPLSMTAAQSGRLFYAEQVEYAVSALDLFEDDEPLGAVAPTHFFAGTPVTAHNIMIHTVKWQFTPTAAETYQLYLLEGATAEAEQQEAEVIFDSGAGMVGGVVNLWVAGGVPTRLPVMARLTVAGTIWYKIDWSGPPGNTDGYIRVYGETFA